MGWQRIRLVARRPHYLDHLRPIWNALPDEFKHTGEWEPTDLILIAGGPDVRKSPNPNWYPYVYVEHGAGQAYSDIPGGQPSSGWSGGDMHDRCRLFIAPNESVRRRWENRYPTTPVAVVGSPRLDAYRSASNVPPAGNVVAITFHWDCGILPETRSAFAHYAKHLPAMVKSYREQGWTVMGHEHPRWAGKLKRYWASIGVPWTDDPLRDANVLIADNTSLMAEMVSLGRPVVALNAPWYRKDVWHGERFWDWDVTYADSGDQAACLTLGTLRRPEWQSYSHVDGKASERAASAIVDLLRPSQELSECPAVES